MDKIFIDTNIIIDFTHKRNRILFELLENQKQNRVQLFINPVVLAEFFTDKNLSEEKKLEEAYELIGFFSSVDISTKIGILAGQFLRERKIISLGDALIAATCINDSFQLATRNRKHFQKIPGLQFYE